MEIALVAGTLVSPAKLDTFSEQLTNHASRSGDSLVFRRDIVFQARAFIDAQLPTLIDGSTKAAVVVASV